MRRAAQATPEVSNVRLALEGTPVGSVLLRLDMRDGDGSNTAGSIVNLHLTRMKEARVSLIKGSGSIRTPRSTFFRPTHALL